MLADRFDNDLLLRLEEIFLQTRPRPLLLLRILSI